MLWVIHSFYLQTIFKSVQNKAYTPQSLNVTKFICRVLFKGLGSSENFFEMIVQGHKEASRSDPAEEISGGYPTPLDILDPSENNPHGMPYPSNF